MVAEAAGSRRRIAVSAVLGARAESTAATLGALDGASEAMPAARASVDARPFVYYIVSSRMRRRRSVKQATCGWTASRRNATQLRAGDCALAAPSWGPPSSHATQMTRCAVVGLYSNTVDTHSDTHTHTPLSLHLSLQILSCHTRKSRQDPHRQQQITNTEFSSQPQPPPPPPPPPLHPSTPSPPLSRPGEAPK